MPDDMIARGIRGGKITIIWAATTVVIQVASLTILARMLTPSDFGIVAMVTVFVLFGNLLRDFGLPLAAMQAQRLSKTQVSNLFWMNTATGLAASAALVLATPFIAHFYSEPRLNAIVPALAIMIAINGMGAQIQVSLARQSRFGTLFVTDAAAQLTGLTVAIVLAMQGANYWALVTQSLVMAEVLLITRWLASGWVPQRPQRGHGSRRLLRNGAEYGAAFSLTFLQENASTLILGSTLGSHALGLYDRGHQLLMQPAGRLLSPLAQVVIPTVVTVRGANHDPGRVLLNIQFLIGATVIFGFSLAAGIGPELVPLVLGTGWEASIPVFQIIAASGCFWILSTVNFWAFASHQLSKELLKYNLVSKPLSLAFIVTGSFYGIEGAAWGFLCGMSVSWPLSLWWLSRHTELPVRLFLRNGLMVLAGATLASLAAHTTTRVIDLTVVAHIGIAAITSAVVYIGYLGMAPQTRQLLKSSWRAMKVLRV